MDLWGCEALKNTGGTEDNGAWRLAKKRKLCTVKRTHTILQASALISGFFVEKWNGASLYTLHGPSGSTTTRATRAAGPPTSLDHTAARLEVVRSTVAPAALTIPEMYLIERSVPTRRQEATQVCAMNCQNMLVLGSRCSYYSDVHSVVRGYAVLTTQRKDREPKLEASQQAPGMVRIDASA